MIIRCPRCGTSYHFDDTRILGPAPILKCSRCQHTFPSPGAKKHPPAPVRNSPPTAPPAAGTLTLPFDEPTWKGGSQEEADDDLRLPDEPEDEFTLGVEPDEKTPARAPAPPKPMEVAAGPPGVLHPPLPVAAEEEAGVGNPVQDVDDENDDADPDEEMRAEADRSGVRAILIVLAFVVLGYGVLARALATSPTLCDRLLGRLPLMGHLNDDRLLVRKVALSDLEGTYQRIRDGKEVFVITGKALNTAAAALHSVQITGKLYDHAGVERDQKTIFCGNVVSAKVLKDLTPREVSVLQKLNPPQRFMIEPGESSTFVIVFMDPPPDAVEFTTQVVGVKRQV